ncbi:MAG: mandelate racemase/muconate lactonizing enzyme family protein, partial [Pseudorhodobacter sp.]|nr:mandelate racemase/muconate lactonizing enzyme family protein [Pseudorhodobacter sp.]
MTKIARIEPIPIEYPDPNDFGTIRRTVLVRVETTDGVVGWGEGIAMWPEACKAVATVISEGFLPLL